MATANPASEWGDLKTLSWSIHVLKSVSLARENISGVFNIKFGTPLRYVRLYYGVLGPQ